MHRSEGIPNAIIRIVVRLFAFPQRVLTRVVLRTNKYPIDPTPKGLLQIVIDARVVDLYGLQLLPPRRYISFQCFLKTKIRNLSFSIFTSLLIRYQAQS